MEIRAYHSHIEVTPYKRGACKQVERLMSTYTTNFNGDGYFEPYLLHIYNETLYLPRGVDLDNLAMRFGTAPLVSTECDSYRSIPKYTITIPPRDNIEKDAIKFLTCDGEFKTYTKYSQFVLTLDTGYGKTYSTVASIIKLKLKSIIIAHQVDILTQWKNTFLNCTSMTEDKILSLDGPLCSSIITGEFDPSPYDVFLVTHQTLQSVIRTDDYCGINKLFRKLKVGIKVIDEIHLFFKSALLIDFHTNTKKSFYLTATFKRSDPSEKKIFSMAFKSAVKFGQETLEYDEYKIYNNYIVTYFKSAFRALPPNLTTYKGFSIYKYIDYEMNDPAQSMVRVILEIISKIINIDGKILILTGTKDSANTIGKLIQDRFGVPVGVIHSDNSKAVNNGRLGMDIMVSTVSYFKAGNDIKGLRFIINAQPIGSPVLADQLRGRLRFYNDSQDTYFYQLVDVNVKDTLRLVNRILPVMKKKCKKIIHYRDFENL